MQYISYGGTNTCVNAGHATAQHPPEAPLLAVCTWRTVEGEAPGVGGGGAEDVLAAGGGHHRVVAGLAAPALPPDRGPGHHHHLDNS